MIRLIKYIVAFLVVLTLNSCLITSTSYQYDYGKKTKIRYLDLMIKQISFDVAVRSDKSEIRIISNRTDYLTNDTISKVYIRKKELRFPDGTVLIKKSRPSPVLMDIDKNGKLIPYMYYYYTCDNIKKKIRKNKYIFLKLVYDIDSLGTIKHYEKEYKLVKTRYYRFGLH